MLFLQWHAACLMRRFSVRLLHRFRVTLFTKTAAKFSNLRRPTNDDQRTNERRSTTNERTNGGAGVGVDGRTDGRTKPSHATNDNAPRPHTHTHTRRQDKTVRACVSAANQPTNHGRKEGTTNGTNKRTTTELCLLLRATSWRHKILNPGIAGCPEPATSISF